MVCPDSVQILRAKSLICIVRVLSGQCRTVRQKLSGFALRTRGIWPPVRVTLFTWINDHCRSVFVGSRTVRPSARCCDTCAVALCWTQQASLGYGRSRASCARCNRWQDHESPTQTSAKHGANRRQSAARSCRCCSWPSRCRVPATQAGLSLFTAGKQPQSAQRGRHPASRTKNRRGSRRNSVSGDEGRPLFYDH